MKNWLLNFDCGTILGVNTPFLSRKPYFKEN